MPDPTPGQSGNQGAPASDAGAPNTPAPSWFDALPDGLRGEPSLQSFKGKDVAALAESHVNAQKLVGGSIRVPGKDAKPEDVEKFHGTLRTHLGVPESAEKYVLSAPANTPEGVTWDSEKAKSFGTFAHSIGLTQKQVEKLAEWDMGERIASMPNHKESFEKCYTSLRDGEGEVAGWGAATDRNLAVAKRTIEVMFGSPVLEQLTKSGMANDPAFIRGLVKIGKELQEDGLIVPEDHVSTAEEHQSELAKIMSDPKHPFYVKDHADHAAAVRRVTQLNQLLYN